MWAHRCKIYCIFATGVLLSALVLPPPPALSEGPTAASVDASRPSHPRLLEMVDELKWGDSWGGGRRFPSLALVSNGQVTYTHSVLVLFGCAGGTGVGCPRESRCVCVVP